VGCGYIGRRVAALLQADSCRVSGCVRSDASLARLTRAGITGLQIDLDLAGVQLSLQDGYPDIFYLAPPPSQGERDTRLAHFLGMLQGHGLPRRMVYISTSAVYGDCQGAWITESQPLRPASARGRRRLDAERQLQGWCEARGVSWMLLRVPGIYGPGKLPLQRLRAGTPLLYEADSPYTNRIHADDLASICVAAMGSERSNRIYNVSDGHPSNMTDYFFRVADAAGLPRPPTVDRAAAEQLLSAGMLSFLRDSRRMRNTRLLDELNISLRYPDLDAGLQDCFTE